MPKLNKTLLRKIRNQILRVPASYYQRSYGRPSRKAECGTAYCIAGHALIQGGAATPQDVARGYRLLSCDDKEWLDFEGDAARLLGISKDDADDLFAGGVRGSWPDEFGIPFDEADDARDYARCARIAADYLNWIIKHGKVK